jgi:hypothetical protein
MIAASIYANLNRPNAIFLVFDQFLKKILSTIARGKVQIWNPEHLSTFSAPQHLFSTSATSQHLSTFSAPSPHLFDVII